MKYALLIYPKPGSHEELGEDESKSVSAEYWAFREDPRCLGGAHLQPIEHAVLNRIDACVGPNIQIVAALDQRVAETIHVTRVEHKHLVGELDVPHAVRVHEASLAKCSLLPLRESVTGHGFTAGDHETKAIGDSV